MEGVLWINDSKSTNITSTDAAIEGKPAWDPTGSTIYYEKGNAQNAATNTNIVKRSISFPGGTPTVGGETLLEAIKVTHADLVAIGVDAKDILAAHPVEIPAVARKRPFGRFVTAAITGEPLNLAVTPANVLPLRLVRTALADLLANRTGVLRPAPVSVRTPR